MEKIDIFDKIVHEFIKGWQTEKIVFIIHNYYKIFSDSTESFNQLFNSGFDEIMFTENELELMKTKVIEILRTKYNIKINI